MSKKKQARIVKLTAEDKIPLGAKFLYAKEEFKGFFGWTHAPNPVYQTVFYYEVLE